MKRLYIHILGIMLFMQAHAQEKMMPAAKQTKQVVLYNATIHIGNGTVLEKASIGFENGKIISLSTTAPADGIDCKGAHIYPGIISPETNLGLTEVEAVRATNDEVEVGTTNTSTRVISAYNTDSKVINTLRSNGVLLANIVPQGDGITGTSSVVQLDAWNWEDAAYKIDNGVYVNMPSFITRFGDAEAVKNAKKNAQKNIDALFVFMKEAKAYINSGKAETTNLKFEALRGVFNKTQKLFVRADAVKQIMYALQLKKQFDIDMVLVGASDSWMIVDVVKEANVPIILNQLHSLPVNQDDDVAQPYKTATQLHKAGILYCLSNEGFWQQRNLAFLAGTSVAYGVPKEDALASITSNAAKILGIQDKTGTLEIGKDANIIVSEGDVLDMKTSKITHAFIQGRSIDLNNKQTMLSERYKIKYGVK
jgi:imidazolonepropionase-like amidohydrolase